MSDTPDTIRGQESPPFDIEGLSSDPDWEEEDDDDMEYEEAEDDTGDDYEGLDADVEFQDASEDLETDASSREQSEEPDGETEGRAGTTATTRSVLLTLEELEGLMTPGQLLQLLGEEGIRNIINTQGGIRVQFATGTDDESSYRRGWGWGGRSRRQEPIEAYKWPPVPNPEGEKLIEDGVFGSNEPQTDTITRQRKKKLAYRTMMRELGLKTPGIERGQSRILRQDMIPSERPDMTINFDARGYCGQFSDDGNFFFTCAQDFRVRMYDTSNPYQWKFYKKVLYYGGNWTITDATLSPDNKFLAYSSIRPQACLAPTDPNDTSPPLSLDFASISGGNGRRGRYANEWGIWSLRFSGDGREIVAGTSDYCIYVYDIDAGRSVLRIPGHKDDVNAVCYGDKSSPHILFSGSDDTTIKVWDRRSLGDHRPAGAFLGHTEGLTYIDSKGDGRYVISNSKDQTMKLWDLRKMIPTEKAETIDPLQWSSGWDYRYPPYKESRRRGNPHDCSLVTFKGHKVVSTLIRCHFSPPGSTDGRYVYSGSTDGCVWVWNMDGSVRATLQTSVASGQSYNYDDEDIFGTTRSQRIIRDVSWHPYAPILATTSWNGGEHNSGTTTVHSWNDGAREDEASPPMGLTVNSELKSTTRPAAATRRTRMGLRANANASANTEEATGRGAGVSL